MSAASAVYVHPARGGVLCARCRGEGRAYLASLPVLERLIAFQQTPFDGRDGERFRLAPTMAAEARALVRCFFAANLSAPLASEKLLESLVPARSGATKLTLHRWGDIDPPLGNPHR